MTTSPPRKLVASGSYLVQSGELRAGDRLSQKDFHTAYCKAPEGYRAELIAGMVFEPAPSGVEHGEHHALLSGVLHDYKAKLRHLQLVDNTTVILSSIDEVQPDLSLRIRPPHGQSSNVKLKKANYIKGAPELVAEISLSSKAIDLHLKKERYEQLGVLEYLVVCVEEPGEVFWFDFKAGKRLVPTKEGILRSICFPGLWIDAPALLSCDSDRLSKVLSRGKRTKAYKEFANRLAVL